MTDNTIIPKQILLNYLHDQHVNCMCPDIKLNASVDIMVPGRRKFLKSKVEFHFHEKHVIVKLLQKDLYPVFPVKFDSRNDIFTVCMGNRFCMEGYSIWGKYRVNIQPVANPFEDYV